MCFVLVSLGQKLFCFPVKAFKHPLESICIRLQLKPSPLSPTFCLLQSLKSHGLSSVMPSVKAGTFQPV